MKFKYNFWEKVVQGADFFGRVPESRDGRGLCGLFYDLCRKVSAFKTPSHMLYADDDDDNFHRFAKYFWNVSRESLSLCIHDGNGFLSVTSMHVDLLYVINFIPKCFECHLCGRKTV